MKSINFEKLYEKMGSNINDKFKFASSPVAEIISALLTYIFAGAGMLLLVYFLFGGFQLMFSAGDPKKVQGAWAKITNAVIGFVIIFLSYWIVKMLGDILKIEIIGRIFA